MRSEEHLPGGVEALPFGLLAAFAEKKEIQITEAAECGFRFRTAERIEIPSYFKICFCEELAKGEIQPSYREVVLERFEMEPLGAEEREEDGEHAEYTECSERTKRRKCEEPYFVSYEVQTDQMDYQQAVRRLLGAYGRYVCLKLEGDDAALAKELVGYPAEQDEEYCENWEEQKNEWKKAWERQKERRMQQPFIPYADIREKEGVGCGKEKRFQETVNNDEAAGKLEVEIAVSLDRPELYQAFLKWKAPAFFRWYCQENGLSGHWLSGKRLGRIYIGNAFCPHLSPEESLLFQMMEKAEKEKLGITMTSSWIREECLEEAEALLGKVECWCQSHETVVEIEVNDWALAEMLKKRQAWLKPCLGVLLHKRRKDPRMKYLNTRYPGKEYVICQNDSSGRQLYSREKVAEEQEPQSENVGMNTGEIICGDGTYADFYQLYLREKLGIERLEWEASPGLMPFHDRKKDRMKYSLHLPYYQTNTSACCPLYARVVRGARGRQALVRDCPQFCMQYTFLYPKHLKMAGRYNSLFGLDDRLLRAEHFPEEYAAMGVDRIVLDFL